MQKNDKICGKCGEKQYLRGDECEDCPDNCDECARGGQCTRCERKFDMDGEGNCIYCAAEKGFFFDRWSTKRCKSCDELDTGNILSEFSKSGKLAEVKIINLPEKPYKIAYPFFIEYATPDAAFMCIKFQVQEIIVMKDRKVGLVSDPAENRHVISERPALMPVGGSIEYRVRSKLIDEASVSWRGI